MKGDSQVVGVVPARFASRRWPGKVLAEVNGRPLVAWAWEALSRVPEISRAAVATDDERIARWAEKAGIPFLMTAPECRNGTERIAEVAEQWPADLYVNVQADQVGLEPRIVGRLVRELRTHPEWQMATLATRVGLATAWNDPDRVLVASEREGLATRFWRGHPGECPRRGVWRHLGLYAYRREPLRAYVAADPSSEEVSQHLEQLRALALGWRIGLVRVRSWARSCDRPGATYRGWPADAPPECAEAEGEP